MAVNAKMKISNKLEEYLIERKSAINSFHNGIEKTWQPMGRQYPSLFKSLEEIEKQHNKADNRAINVLKTINEIEELLKELHYDR